ncbi:TetR/AcrR family transcriptional regulator [Pseudoroseicyclus sp. H15]
MKTAKTNRKPEVATEDRILAAAHHEFVSHGFAGARIERIVKQARVNPRMIYHHFGGKSGLYLAVLEGSLAGLREREMMVDFAHEPPIEGLLKLSDFLNDYFRETPDLVRLLTNENIEGARHMKASKAIGEMSSPVLDQIGGLLERGEKEGSIQPGIDPLVLYIQLVALSQFHISNMHTLTTIFSVDIASDDWRDRHRAATRTMISRYLGKVG